MSKINGKYYDWASIEVSIQEFDLQVQSIDYDDTIEREKVYGYGQAIKGYSEGNYDANAKITLLRDDFNALLDYCKDKGMSLYKVNIPKIIVSYANDGEKIRKDVVNNVLIGKVANKGAQGDKKLTVDLELFVVGNIERDGVKAI